MEDFPTALGLAAAVRNRDVSPTELVGETLRRIDERNEAINAVIWVDPDDARRRARAAEDRLASGGPVPPFLGVPIAIKDLDEVAGWPTTFGSAGASDEPSSESASVVLQLEAAGFVLVGRTNTPEFGPITAAENTRYGISRNPWNTDRSPGGSSGGASAATAAGIYAAAHANDGGGSIRIPASCCDLVGHKASRGLVVQQVQMWEGAAVQGAVTHTVADTAAILDVIAVHDPLSWWKSPLPQTSFTAAASTQPEPLRVAVISDSPLGLPTDPECSEAARRTASALEAAGHCVVEVPVDFQIDRFLSGYTTVVNAGLADYDGLVDWSRTEPHNRAARAALDEVDAATYVKAVSELQRWSRDVNAQWSADFDVLVTPTMPNQPVPAGQILREVHAAPDELSPTLLSTVTFTAVFNMSGLPAISIPAHVASDTGLPIGAQIVAPPFRDDLCLSLAAQLEPRMGWVDRNPDLAGFTAG
ncbi:MAG TPA: amidase [Acidimicrobiales bacterium]|nr:amidase [Acidimicrobiales bacterium]